MLKPSDSPHEIIGDFDTLIDWTTAFHILRPVTDARARACYVGRLRASGYTVNEEAIGVAIPGNRTRELFVCNCGTAIHYCLCKHSVTRARIDGIITALPAQFNTAKRVPGPAKSGRPEKAAKGGAFGQK
jgi:hypothetical protein